MRIPVILKKATFNPILRDITAKLKLHGTINLRTAERELFLIPSSRVARPINNDRGAKFIKRVLFQSALFSRDDYSILMGH